MSYSTKDNIGRTEESILRQALLDENKALNAEIQRLRMHITDHISVDIEESHTTLDTANNALISSEENLRKAYTEAEKIAAIRAVELEMSTKLLKDSEERYRSLFDNMTDGFILYEVILDTTGLLHDLRFVEANEVFAQMIGAPRDEILGDVVSHLFPHANIEYMKSINKTICTRQPQNVKWHSDAVGKWFETNTYIPKDGFVAVIFRDITTRKREEEKVIMLASAVASSNDAIMTISLDGIITSWNKGAEQLYCYKAEDVINKNINILEPDNRKGEIEEFSKKIKEHKVTQRYETTRQRKDGSIVHVAVTLSPICDSQGNYIALSAVVRDITERKRAEATLLSIETARKKEIHHRIKNNLQVISSLLDLQADKFRGKLHVVCAEVMNAFKESQDRVISMALIHEELYRGGNLEELNFSPYVVNLADHLLKTYNVKDVSIELKMDIVDNAFFDMDVAVPLGIIINELVANSFKYAFKGRNSGEIKITLDRDNSTEENTNFILTVSDNGVGIAEDLNIEDLDSLGMQLVVSLVDQLDGTLELHRNGGTKFIMHFSSRRKHQ